VDHVRVLISIAATAADSGNGVPAQIADAHDQIVLGLIATLTIVVSALVYIVKSYSGVRSDAKTAATQATATNKAVNNVETGELSLYRLVDQNSKQLDELHGKLDSVLVKQAAFDKAWGNLPGDIDDAVGLSQTLHDITGRIDKLDAALADHVMWEMSQKYPK
jgi:hypothetical protein